jgi:YggT family protein
MKMLVVVSSIVNFIVLVISLLVILKVVLSYFVAPYQPVRLFVDRIVEPMLRPIQRIIPPIGGLDLSPLILLVIVQILGRIIIGILSMLLH